MVEIIHPISQDDTENRSEYDDNGQVNHRTTQRDELEKDRHFYLGLRRSSDRKDKNCERQRSERNEHHSTIVSLSGRFIRKSTRTEGNS